jgi:hypothetical protein
MSRRIVHANGVDLCVETFGDDADPGILLSTSPRPPGTSWSQRSSR